jgi:predicted transcriptional regulator
MAGRKKPSDPPKTGTDSDAFLAWLEQVPDPRERYRRATQELEKHQQAVERLSSLRVAAAADAYESGDTVRGLAGELGVSPARMHQLIQQARQGPAKEPAQKRRRSSRKKGES